MSSPSDARSPGTPGSLDLRRLLAGVALLAFVVRLLHNHFIVADPLYWTPLGGNLPYLLLAERIAGGELVPFDGPITVNSPLYPYILAALYEVLGMQALEGIRLVAAAVDSATAALLALLAFRRFGLAAGWVAGVAWAVYGPAVFFALDLNPVPWTLALLTGALVLLDRGRRPRTFLAAGLLLGLATGTRPNVLLAGLLALAVPWTRGLPGAARAAGALAVGLALGVAPVPAINAAAGAPVLLTASAGHNLYIGHNPAAEAQYALPATLDGDIFATMKGLAEDVEGRRLDDTEVSGWYVRRAWAHVLRNPGRELELLGRRGLLLVNDFEATTYANYRYQEAWSPVLRWAPTFAWLFALAAPGMLLALRRERWHLWIPLLTGAVTVLGFFYIARLRIVVAPTLALLAGAAVGRGVELWRRGDRSAVAAAGLPALLALGLASLPLLESDTSNEWNKAGGVLRIAGRPVEAERALLRARAENPANPNTYRNLTVLYEQTGRPAEAAEARAALRELEARERSEGERFREELRDLGGR